MDIVEDKLKVAFDLVSPAAIAKRALEDKKLPASMAKSLAQVSWKDPIKTVLRPDDLQAAGVTADDIKSAVLHYTATPATIQTMPSGALFIKAPGYRAGPAGDH